MEFKKRGALETVLDTVTEDGYLQSLIGKFTEFKNENIIDSIKSAVIGAIYLHALNSYLIITRDIKKDFLEKEEKDFDVAFLRRTPEIITKINLLLNR